MVRVRVGGRVRVRVRGSQARPHRDTPRVCGRERHMQVRLGE